MKYSRRIHKSAIAIVAVWLIACAAIGSVAVEGALHPGRKVLSRDDEALAESIAARNHAAIREVAVTAEDGATLRAWSMRPISRNGDAVILLHGQADNRAGMLGNADMLLRHGYAVLLPDARAHGASGGQLATYGVKKAGDLRRWFDWLAHNGASQCIDGLGDSMGAAQLLRSLTLTPQFCAVAAESPFSTFQEASYDRIGQGLQTGPWLGRTLLRPAVELGFLYSDWKYGVDLSQASPESAVAASRVPVLLIHGLADTNLPPRHSEAIKSANPSVVVWEPLGVGHCGAAGAEPAEYERRVVGWFASHDRRNDLAAAR